MTADRGSAAPLFVVGGALVVAGTVAGGSLVAASVAHTRADGVADLVALAAAGALLEPGGPCVEAQRIAEANGARLSSCEPTGAVVRVGVGVELPRLLVRVTGRRSAEATAAAELIIDEAALPPGSVAGEER